MDLLKVFEDSDDLLQFSPGMVIFEEETNGELMYVIVKGEVGLSLHGESVATLSAGEILGEMALIHSDPRSTTATALTECALAPIDLHSFRSLIQYTPDFALHIMSELADRLRRSNESLADSL